MGTRWSSTPAIRSGTCITCAPFEVVFEALLLKGKVTTYGLEMRDFETTEGFKIRPHRLLAELQSEDEDLFIVPGGRPNVIAGNTLLGQKLRDLNSKGKLLAAT